MLLIIRDISLIDKRKFFGIYEESTRENAEEFYPGMEINAAVKKAEGEFTEFLEEFMSRPENSYWILEEDGVWVSALRLTQTEPGFYYLEALETRPDSRRRGCAARLIAAVTDELKKQGPFRICDCVSKRNLPSIRTHEACGFRIASDAGFDYLSSETRDWDYGFEYSYDRAKE
ncbi:MAG: GNAT family N-acetyltransferase [Clostridiales bacterium]|nr:GNAT family N-acetyltransferase [Clostridiales bacterium]